jgi:hypothetical protein
MALSATVLLLTFAAPAQGTVTPIPAHGCGAADEPARALCTRYIAGFLDGAQLTDTAIVVNLSQGERSAFLDRALRTRTGLQPATALANFCLPGGVSTGKVARQVVDHLIDDDFSKRPLRDQVYDQVKVLFPCQGSAVRPDAE